MQAGHVEKKWDLRISAARKLEPEVIHDKMIKEYVEQYNRENKIFHEGDQPITHITVLALSFKST